MQAGLLKELLEEAYKRDISKLLDKYFESCSTGDPRVEASRLNAGIKKSHSAYDFLSAVIEQSK